MPPRPKTVTAGQDPVVVFDGAMSSKRLPHESRIFNLELTFDDHHPHLLKTREQEPPEHFHYFQDEFIQVLEGSVIHPFGKERLLLTPADGEVCIPPYVRNNLIPGPLSEDQKTTRFLLSGPAADSNYMLDLIFYENYYRYLDQAVSGNESIDLIQVLSMFDAGASGLCLPWWIPFNMTISRVLGIVVGRWLGGLLSYQPYYKE
ncbi:hypothetical protein BDV95DRAFT_580310 [Massariosphaeria phaeospora]|uniref:Cupin 2 conserved barrel domain-containing protein n=1 Tax=Massariosphaeria phaeospora TaxID=100035 RepID=A0A7C8M5N0_9PLEO|nr:hypothetical protein BDV95DRAFT_580310 [Massariosphaeria phaeospora]